MEAKVAVRSESTTSRQCPTVSSAVGTGMPLPPANAARMWTGPSRSAMVAAARCSSCSTVQSARTASAAPPAAVIESATPASACSSRPMTATLAPLAASARAVWAPMPREPPVTTATRPARSA